MRAFADKKDKGRKPALFLDRDGVLIRDREGFYLKKLEEVRVYPTAVEGLKKISGLGYRLIVLTNQSAIARGYISLSESVGINKFIAAYFRKRGVKISGIYFCPHLPDSGCSCRKPSTGLVKEALKDFRTDLKRSFMAGDKQSDMKLAAAAGLNSVFVLTGQARKQMKKYNIKADFRIKDLRGLKRALKNL
ncbi:MAG: HAD family hydrolase [Elusimicrobia bacterium CG08_land_8_20_14_0_20_51_18]|nr:MAG: HAD family hydrolase [Elusimicrobia bacterium CG08_land_8_20_14_0_20_51_18]